jgi:hypothetical protein
MRAPFRDPSAVLRQPKGGFALALFEPQNHRVLLATDPLGIQPFYSWTNGQRVFFVTRLERSVRSGKLSLELYWTAIYHDLNVSYAPSLGTTYPPPYALFMPCTA